MMHSQRVLRTAFAVSVLFVAASTMAQNVEIPVPIAVFKDRDGKVLAPTFGDDPPSTFLNVDGKTYRLRLRTSGPYDMSPAYFFHQDSECSGPPFIPISNEPEPSMFEHAWIQGPDAVNGTYLFWRFSGEPVTGYFYSFSPIGSGCERTDVEITCLPSEAPDPNPLDGFHGPTLAHPEWTWTIDGGVRITPP